MKILTLLLSGLLCPFVSMGGGEPFPLGARNWAMAASMAGLPAVQSPNPAALGFVQDRYFQASYHNRFGLRGLDHSALAFNTSFSEFRIGAELWHFGDKLYHESKVGITLARNTGRVALGLRFNYLNVGVSDVSSRHTLVTEFGVMARLSPRVTAGMHVFSITRARLYPTQQVPLMVSLGVSALISEQLTLCAQADYRPGGPPLLRAGLEYRIHEVFFVRSGVSPASKGWHYGVGWHYGKYLFDYGGSSDAFLGMSHQITLSLQLKNTTHEKSKKIPD